MNKSEKSTATISYVAVLLTLLLSLPLIFLANADNRLTAAAFPDSGELIQNIIDLMSWNYDQTQPSHIALYGWLYNIIIYWQYQILHLFFDDIIKYYPLYAFLARLNSVAISVSVIVLFPRFLALFVNNRYVILWATLCLALFQPFSLFSYQVHPDNLGVLVSLLATFYITRYFQEGHLQYLRNAIIFALLAPACKQYYIWLTLTILVLVCVSYFAKHKLESKPNAKEFLIVVGRAIFIGVFVLFLIHPYAFLKPDVFLERQLWLKNSGFSNGTFELSFYDWINNYLSKDFILLGGILASIFYLISTLVCYLRKKFLNEQQILLLALSCYCIFHIIYILFTMRNSALHYFHYFLPVYPYCILLICVTGLSIVNAFKKNGTSTFDSTLLAIVFSGIGGIVLSINFIHAIWQASHYAGFYYTNQYEARDYLKKLNWKELGVGLDSKVLYSTMIPIPDRISKHYINDWAFDTRSSRGYQAVIDWNPDVMIVDCEHPSSNTEQFIQIAQKLGLTLKFSKPKVSAYIGSDPSRFRPMKEIMKILHYNFLLFTDKLRTMHFTQQASPAMLVFIREPRSQS